MPNLMFVQFPHPGSEHKPAGLMVPWNQGAHARKFLTARGQFLAGALPLTGSVTFWGEWEPQSQVIKTFQQPAAGMPRYLHKPDLQVPAPGPKRQNTDPLVFGDQFLYSNCRQERNHRLLQLAAESIVLFGSKLEGRFVLDTVFVVGESIQNYLVATSATIPCSPAVQAVVFGALRSDPTTALVEYRLYSGRTHKQRPDGPFSFVPCLPYGSGGALTFARPVIQLDPKWITPNLAMAAKATEATSVELTCLWHEVKSQVLAQGLALAIQIEMP
jgi:hypothetical protein